MIGSQGLVRVKDPELVALLRAVHRGTLACPITRPGLAAAGLLSLGDDLEILRGLDVAGVTAVVVSVLAERRRARPAG